MDFADVYTRLENTIKSFDPSVDTSKGPLKDVILGPLSQVLSQWTFEIEQLRAIAFQDWDKINSDTLDSLASSASSL